MSRARRVLRRVTGEMAPGVMLWVALSAVALVAIGSFAVG